MQNSKPVHHADDHGIGGEDIRGGGFVAMNLDNPGETLGVETSGYLFLQSGDNTQIINTGAGGVTIQDGGDGGVTVQALGTGSFLTLRTIDSLGAGGLNISNNGSSGIGIGDTSAAGLTIDEAGSGNLILSNSGTGGILLQANTTGSGIVLSADNPIILTALGGTTSGTIQLRITDGNYVGIINSTATSEWLRVGSNGIAMFHLPTSSAGLPSGFLWNNAGTVKIV